MKKDTSNTSVYSEIPEEIEQGQFNDVIQNAEKEFKVYPQRYIMAFLYIIACLSISLQQNTFAPQGSYLAKIYVVDPIMVTMTSLIPMILHAPVSFPANFIVDKFGVKAGIVIAAICCIIGTWIRCLINTVKHGFRFALLGQFFVGIANPFVINSLNKVSANWFYPGDRAGVTSFLSFFSTITGLVGLLMPGIWFSGYNGGKELDKDQQDYLDRIEEGKRIQFNLCFVQAILITCMMLPNIFFFRNKPPTPPSFTSSVDKEDFKVALKLLSKSRDYLFQCLSFAFFYGSFTLLAVVLNFVLVPFGLGDPIYSSILSIMPIASGIIGCIVSSIHLKKHQKYKKIILTCMVGSTISLIGFGVILWTESFYLTMPTVFAVGLFVVPLIPCMLEFACETSFPIGEATATGFIYASAHIFGGVGGIGLTGLLGNPNDISQNEARLRSMLVLGLMVFFFSCGLILTIFTKQDLKRLNAEKTRQVKQDED